MNNISGMLTSKNYEYSTSMALFKEWDDKYHFTLDVCATKKNAKCKRYFTKKHNGLMQHWTGKVWMNPPYGRGIWEWVFKAHNAFFKQDRRTNTDIVCLLPARTDTRWFHNCCLNGRITFIRGRIRFDGYGQAPFPSMIVEFTNRARK